MASKRTSIEIRVELNKDGVKGCMLWIDQMQPSQCSLERLGLTLTVEARMQISTPSSHDSLHSLVVEKIDGIIGFHSNDVKIGLRDDFTHLDTI